MIKVSTEMKLLDLLESYAENRSDDKYRSPLSQIIATTTPFSMVSHSFNAAVTEPPLLIPAKTPSSYANRLVMALASASLTSII